MSPCRDHQQSSPTRIPAERNSQLLDRNLVETALSRSLDFASLDELDPSLGMSASWSWKSQLSTLVYQGLHEAAFCTLTLLNLYVLCVHHVGLHIFASSILLLHMQLTTSSSLLSVRSQ